MAPAESLTPVEAAINRVVGKRRAAVAAVKAAVNPVVVSKVVREIRDVTCARLMAKQEQSQEGD